MRIQIITIGNELLEGQIVNTNSSFLCKELYKVGYLTERQISILDDPQTMLETFEESLEEYDITICSGGLGPTLDDRTLKVACTLFDTEMVFDPKLESKLKLLIRHVKVPNLKASCFVPKSAHAFSDHVGMAPGFVFTRGQKKMIFLPGVPHELHHLVKKEVIPLILKTHPLKEQEYKKVIHLCRVAESGIAPYLEKLQKEHPKIDFGIYPHMGVLSIHTKNKASSLEKAIYEIDPVLNKIEEKYPLQFFDGKFETIQEALHHFFIENKLSFSCAESCTGGALASSFTQLPDASKYFQGALVAYHNSVKVKDLQVSEQTLNSDGAVSVSCAKEMALGANSFFNTDLAISTSGIAGPSGGSPEKPVGTVCVAIAFQGQIIFNHQFQFKGSRDTIIKRTILYTLAELWMIRDNIQTKK